VFSRNENLRNFLLVECGSDFFLAVSGFARATRGSLTPAGIPGNLCAVPCAGNRQGAGSGEEGTAPHTVPHPACGLRHVARLDLLRADTGKDLAVGVREYFIPDFSNWKNHDAFEKSLAWPLQYLRAEESKA
jgi:hypothetical protein